MRPVIVTCFLSVISVLGIAQVTGRIVSKENGEPVVHALVRLQCHYNYFTTSNASGSFRFHIPPRFRYDSIVISSAGFETLTLSQLAFAGSNVWYLNQAPDSMDIRLENIVGMQLRLIAEDAITSSKKFLPDERHELRALARITTSRKGRPYSLMEADISMYDDSYSFDPRLAAIRINHLRQTQDNDSIRYIVPHDHPDVSSFNPFYRAYESSLIRVAGKFGTVFNDARLFGGDKTFRLMDVRKSGDQILLTILFSGNYGASGSITEFGYLTVDLHSRLLTGFERALYDNDVLIEKVVVDFARHEGRLFPKSIVSVGRKPGQITGLEYPMFEQRELYVYLIKNLKRIPERNIENRMRTAQSNSNKYDERFWEDYAQLKRHPTPAAVVTAFGEMNILLTRFKAHNLTR